MDSTKFYIDQELSCDSLNQEAIMPGDLTEHVGQPIQQGNTVNSKLVCKGYYQSEAGRDDTCTRLGG